MRFKPFLMFVCMILSTTSCGYLLREIVTPNNCKKCQIYNQSNDVVWERDECGGDVYNMELKAKAEAYDFGCDYTLKCNSYKKDD